MATRERQIWAFQANPNDYDIEGAVRGLAVDTWMVGKSDVQLGDLAVIWKAKGGEINRGIVAFGVVISSPFDADDKLNPYWRNASKKAEKARRARIRYLAPRNAPYWESDHAWVGNLSVARGQQTVFHVQPDEWLRATKLIERNDPVVSWLAYEYPKAGDDWTPVEYELAMRIYLEMLDEQRAGITPNKATYKRRLEVALPHRTSLDYRFQNISSGLAELDLEWLQGYKPLSNIGSPLLPHLQSVLQSTEPSSERPTPATTLQEALPPVPRPPRQSDRRATRAPVDHEWLSNRRREIGRRGEHLVAEHERQRLRDAKRHDLASRVEIISETQGDTAGYDILSFEENGNERHIEVKTTTGGADAPFYMSLHEWETSKRLSPTYHLFRVYDLDGQPHFYRRRPPLDAQYDFEAITFRVTTKPASDHA